MALGEVCLLRYLIEQGESGVARTRTNRKCKTKSNSNGQGKAKGQEDDQ